MKTWHSIFTKQMMKILKHLINLNYPKGKLFGEIMSNLLNEKLKNKILNNKILSKEEEINWVLNQFPQKEK